MCREIADVFILFNFFKCHPVEPELQQFEQKVVASVGHDVLGPPATLETPCLPSVRRKPRLYHIWAHGGWGHTWWWWSHPWFFWSAGLDPDIWARRAKLTLLMTDFKYKVFGVCFLKMGLKWLPCERQLTWEAARRCWGSCTAWLCAAPAVLRGREQRRFNWCTQSRGTSLISTLLDSLQLSGMTFRARGSRSSKEASSTTDWISGYDITAQLAEVGEKVAEEDKLMESFAAWLLSMRRIPLLEPW